MDQRESGRHSGGCVSGDEARIAENANSFATSMLESSNDLVAAVDSELRFVALNAPFRREFKLIFGVPLHSGQRLNDVLSHFTKDREKAAALCQRALAGEAFRVIETFGDDQLLRKSYEFAFTPIFDTFHQPIYAAIVVRDLTMSRANERRFGALLEAAPDATIIMRSDGTIDLANTHAERMFGYGRHKMLGLPVERLIPERFRARHTALRHQFSLHPGNRPMGSGRTDLVGLRADGSEFPVEISLNPLDVGGDTMVVAAIRDMTVRQRAEDKWRALSAELERRVVERTAELEHAHKTFKTTFEQASVGIAHVGLDGKWIQVNQTLCDIVGYTNEEITSLTFQDITYPDDLDADLKLMYQLLAGEISAYAMDKRYVRKSGKVIWINLNASLVRDQHGAPEYFIAIVKDISDRKRAEAALQKSRDDLELAVSATGVGMFDYYPQTGDVHWSAEIKRQYGLELEERIDYNATLSRVHPEDRKQVDAQLQQAMQDPSHSRFDLEYRIIRFDDKLERWIQARGQFFFDGGRPWRCIGTSLDITEKKQAEEALRESERQLRLIFDATPIGMVRRAVSGEILEANAAFLRLTGRRREDVAAGKLRWDRMTPPEHLAADRKAMEQAARKGISEIFEKEYVRANGERVPVLVAFASAGVNQDIVGFVLDISERKQVEERIRQAALHDPLTGLPNRELLFDYAKRIFARARRSRQHSAVLFVDLDRFKLINDNYGHEAGDEVLREVARRITDCTRGEDIAFRLGGDEFIVLLPEIDTDANAGEVARHMANCLNRPYHVDGLELSVSPSVGISIYPQDGEDIDTLVSRADAAMYLAKQAGRNSTQFYSQELAAQSQLQSRIEAQVKAALAQNAFELFYQPVIDMRTSQLIGVEALVRWPHADVGPDRFVPVAESTGQINQLGEWVICEACRQHKKWLGHGLPAIPIAVNVSAVQLRNHDFAHLFADLMGYNMLNAAALQIEVTETALMENLDRALDVLTQLQRMGVKIALDDFGTGYSSLNYLSRLPINKIKVDKSFVQRIDHDMASRAITQAIIALGRTLMLEVVAEGIESESALHYLRQHGCNHAQGYLVCKPVNAEAFEAWYRGQITVGTH